jgi:redox-sensitive bicupin YhaK (pirin superfamily)
MVQPIRPGAVNWMTAGRGIVHSERTDTERRQHPNPLHGLQIWLALPLEKEDTEPEFNHYPSGSLPRVTRGSVEFTLIAGRALGAESPVRVFSPLFYMEGRLDRGAGFKMFREYPERAVYVVDGTISIDGVAVGSRCMAVFDKDAAPRVTATDDARVAVFGGESVGPRRIWWNFVASSRARIRAAAERWADGGFERVPGDDEFIPLPDDLPWKD